MERCGHNRPCCPVCDCHRPPQEDSPEPYVANAQFHLDLLRSIVHDGLSSSADLFLKVSLIQEIDSMDTNLRKALA